MVSVIRAEDVGKRYRLGQREAYRTLRDSLATVVTAPFRGPSRRDDTDRYVWALHDVSFQVGRGEAVGLIGKNGAGKSTMLKILSRVTEPTQGWTETRGKVASLLEVGTGFHPELTGRENIYLSGAVLGMKRAEINRRFDEIVAFAEVERFVDTPVKRYSSGMYVRLAFSVAVHLEPDILILDEVLAVGDAHFQKKCLAKMEQVINAEGRTILFVSHNMDAIRRICSRCLLFDRGRLVFGGDAGAVVSRYLATAAGGSSPGERIDLVGAARTGTGEAMFVAVQYSSLNPDVSFQPFPDGPLQFLLEIESDRPRSVPSMAVTVSSDTGVKYINADTVFRDRPVCLREGRNTVTLTIRQLHLNPGRYVFGLWLADPDAVRTQDSAYDHIESAGEIEVVSDGPLSLTGAERSLVTCEFDVAEAG